MQTVDRREHPRFHGLLSRFHARTGCPVLVNTSFNVRGEPIVCTPQDALRCFFGTEMDVLVLENFVVRRAAQETAAPAFEATRNVVLELLEPASEGWARVRHVEGFEGYVHASEVWGL